MTISFALVAIAALQWRLRSTEAKFGERDQTPQVMPEGPRFDGDSSHFERRPPDAGSAAAQAAAADGFFLDTARWALSLADIAERDAVFEELMREWVHHDPKAAAAFVLSLDEVPLRDALLRSLAASWARSDAVEALSWAAFSSKSGSQTLVYLLGVEVAAFAPEQCIQLLLDLGQAPKQQALVEDSAAAWASEDPASALAWAASLSSDEQRMPLFTRILHVWGREDPVAAARAVSALDLPEAQSAEALSPVMAQWASRDFDQALAWADEISSPATRHRVFRALDGSSARQLESHDSER